MIPPQILSDNGGFEGLSIDYIQLLERKFDYHFELVPFKTWNEVIQASRSRHIDMIFAAQSTPERMTYLAFTEPYIELPNRIIVRKEREGGASLAEMKDWTVAVSMGSAVHEFLQSNYSDLELYPVQDELGGLMKVSLGEVDAMVVELSRASYYIEKAGILNLRVAGDAGLLYQLRFAVRSDWPELVKILDKGLSSISDDEKRAINRRWIIVGEPGVVTSRVFWSWLAVVLGLIVLTILGAVLWTRTLRLRVRQHTSQLRQELIVRERAERELDRFNRALRMLGDISQAMIHITVESALLEEACRIAVEVGGYGLTWIGFPESGDEDGLRMVAHAGVDSDAMDSADVGWINHGSERHTLEKALRSGQPCIARTLTADPDFANWQGVTVAGDYQSYIMLPLVSEGQVLGVMGIYSSTADAFDVQEVEILQRLAGELAFGINAIRLQTSRMQAERALRQSEENYRALIQKIQAAVVVHGVDTKILSSNAMAQQLLGMTEDQMLGKSSVDPSWHFIREDGSTLPLEEYPVNQVLASHKALKNLIVGIHRTQQDEDVWVLVNAVPVFNEANEITQVIVTFIDISVRKRAEEALKESEAFLESIVENIPNMIFIKDADELRFIRLNRAGEQLLGYKREELLGKNDYDFFSKKQADSFTRKDREILASGQLYDIPEEPINTKTGTRLLHTKKLPILDKDGKPAFLLGISEDITERKRAVVRLQRSEKSLAHAQRMTHLGSWELDLLNKELTWSDEVYRIFEIEPGVFGASYEAFLDAIHPDDREYVNQAYTQSLETRQPYNIVHRLQMRDGRIKYVNERCETEFDQHGKPLRSIGTVQDITERKHNEDELRRYRDHLEDEVRQRTAELVSARDAAQAANKSKSIFLANMSHELRTPLNSILGFSSLMSKEPQLSAEQRENLSIINRSGAHLLTLINDVLEMAKIEAGGLELDITPFDLGDLVRDVIDLMQLRCQEKGLQLQLDQTSAFPRFVKGDKARLNQILLNLLSNAVKFTDKGSVTLRLSVADSPRQPLCIEVADSGPGIKPEDLERLFNPFVQLKERSASQGTGLGLTITRQFVQMMGGEISLDSEYGKGSLFRVVLPLELATEEEVSRDHEKKVGDVIGLAPGQPDLRILIAEDQRDNQLLLNHLMTNIGLETRVVENGDACVKTFRQWHPHLIWMDWRMPVMDGVEACRMIRALPGGDKVKIIAVTASAFKEEREEAIKAGMDDLVRKPYRIDELYACMASQLDLKYRYAETEDQSFFSVTLTPAMLEVISADLRSKLYNALLSLESERIMAIIREIAEIDAKLGVVLERLARDFDYQTILQVLDPDSIENSSPQSPQ